MPQLGGLDDERNGKEKRPKVFYLTGASINELSIARVFCGFGFFYEFKGEGLSGWRCGSNSLIREVWNLQ
jgi:hypothetical protein